MGRYKNLISIFTLAVMVMGLTVVASAQWRDNRRNSGYYGNSNLNSTIKNLRNNARRFEDVLDRELDRSRYDGTRREDNLNRLAERFKNAAEDLDDEYDGYRSMRSSSDEARRVISTSQQLGNALRRSRANRNRTIRSYWNRMQNDIRIIARAYNTRYNGRNDRWGRNDRGRNDRWGRNDRNRRNNRNGSWGRRGNLRSTIVSLKYKSARFEDRIDREFDDDYGRRRYRSNVENLSDRFNDAVKDLEDEYDNNRDYNDSFDEVRRVLSLGQQLDREISRSRVNRSLRNEWNSIERDLRTIARAYNMSYNGRYNNNRRISDIWRNFPF